MQQILTSTILCSKTLRWRSRICLMITCHYPSRHSHQKTMLKELWVKMLVEAQTISVPLTKQLLMESLKMEFQNSSISNSLDAGHKKGVAPPTTGRNSWIVKISSRISNSIWESTKSGLSPKTSRINKSNKMWYKRFRESRIVELHRLQKLRVVKAITHSWDSMTRETSFMSKKLGNSATCPNLVSSIIYLTLFSLIVANADR